MPDCCRPCLARWCAHGRRGGAALVKAVRDKARALLGHGVAAARIPDLDAEGLALMRLAEALLRGARHRNRDRVAADQLARLRSMRTPAALTVLAGLSASAIALSRSCCPKRKVRAASSCAGARRRWCRHRRGDPAVGTQFRLGAFDHGSPARSPRHRSAHAWPCASATTAREGARTDCRLQRYLASYLNAIDTWPWPRGPIRHCGRISIKIRRSLRATGKPSASGVRRLLPRVWSSSSAPRRANINLTIDAGESAAWSSRSTCWRAGRPHRHHLPAVARFRPAVAGLPDPRACPWGRSGPHRTAHSLRSWCGW